MQENAIILHCDRSSDAGQGRGGSEEKGTALARRGCAREDFTKIVILSEFLDGKQKNCPDKLEKAF